MTKHIWCGCLMVGLHNWTSNTHRHNIEKSHCLRHIQTWFGPLLYIWYLVWCCTSRTSQNTFVYLCVDELLMCEHVSRSRVRVRAPFKLVYRQTSSMCERAKRHGPKWFLVWYRCWSVVKNLNLKDLPHGILIGKRIQCVEISGVRFFFFFSYFLLFSSSWTHYYVDTIHAYIYKNNILLLCENQTIFD